MATKNMKRKICGAVEFDVSRSVDGVAKELESCALRPLSTKREARFAAVAEEKTQYNWSAKRSTGYMQRKGCETCAAVILAATRWP